MNQVNKMSEIAGLLAEAETGKPADAPVDDVQEDEVSDDAVAAESADSPVVTL